MVKNTIFSGEEDFKTIIDKNYYYVDKTDLIEDTFDHKVILYTRPRRFGKTLNMSMFYYFYSLHETKNRYLFDGLKISESDRAKAEQNQYPVIRMSLKDVSGKDFQSALEAFADLISDLYVSFPEFMNSPHLTQEDIQKVLEYRKGNVNLRLLKSSLYDLTKYLYKYYKRKSIILIDEYDVPLNAAWENGYYDEMCSLLQRLFSKALKTNEYLEKGIFTGCLRISKESIFTGLNNFFVNSILTKSDVSHNAGFGFTQQEIDRMFEDFGQKDKLPIVKKWYDGYLFGGVEVYNPWSVLLYLQSILKNPASEPVSWWANSSGNSIVTSYISQSDQMRQQEFEELMNGKPVHKRIQEELTFRELEDPDNIYSFLLLTGYLKSVGADGNGNSILMIPNLEVQKIYENHFIKLFNDLERDIKKTLFLDMLHEDVESVQRSLTALLQRSLSYYDNIESFYHGLMVGLLQIPGYRLSSNREAGLGRYDVVMIPETHGKPMVILELKHSSSENKLMADAEEAITQIQNRKYLKDSEFKYFPRKIAYGISFYKKSCAVRLLSEKS